MNYYPLHKNELALLFIKLNVAIHLPCILYSLIFTCRWPHQLKHVVKNYKY